ncbi:MAG TPA: hypothetical protein VK168_20345 [Saprospiraceae bacterium]|nr:hypothetical protein [Saprospiraceae bacterium]
MRNLIYIFLFFAVCTKTNAQKLDTTLMLFKAKICLLEYSNVKSNNEVLDFFNRDLPFTFLKSKGFSNRLLFVEVPIAFDSISAYKFVYNYKFIFAYNCESNVIYRLKGFRDNEFNDFFRALHSANNIDYNVASETDLSSMKKFVTTFKVDNLDFECLYKTLKKRPKNKDCIVPAKPLID